MAEWLTRIYDRGGTAAVIVGGSLVLAMVSTAVNVLLGARFFDLNPARLVSAEVLVELATLSSIGAAVFAVRRELQSVVRWIGGERHESEGAAVARAARALPRRALIGGYAACAVVTCPTAVVLLLRDWRGAAALDYLAVYCFALLVSLYGLLLAWFWLQATMRPVLADIAVKAPAANRVEGANQSVVLKMLIALVYATTLAGLIVGSLQRRPGSGARGMLATGALGFGASLSVILILVLLAGLRVLEPLRELIRGTEAVATGDLEVQVPVTSNDELGMLAQRFNEMVSGLRDRERLRKDNLGLVDELRASRERIVTTADQERRRLERDLHDGAQQHLVLLGLKLDMLNRMISKDPVRSEHLVEELQADLGHAVKELRDLAHGLYPAVLETDGLDGALREAANHAPIPTKISCDSTSRYPSELEAAVYFCCLEALQNAAKHAGKRAHATIRLEHNDSTLQFEVIDDGQGFNPATAPASAGLQNMSDRIGALGGTLTVNSEPGSGTTILGRIPIHT